MGQYWDEEKNSSYNYFRDYDSKIGRYIQSDPIGLNGGFNTYGYVGANPLGAVDPLGQEAITSIINNNINIHVPIGIYGKNFNQVLSSGETRGQATAKYLSGEVNKFWSKEKWKYGKCSVSITFDISVGTNKLNNLEIVDTNAPVRSGVWGKILKNKIINATTGIIDIRGKNQFVHEVGHLMSLIDQYTDPPYGNSIPHSGWENNIMGSAIQGSVEQRNITNIVENLLSNQQLKVCECIK